MYSTRVLSPLRTRIAPNFTNAFLNRGQIGHTALWSIYTSSRTYFTRFIKGSSASANNSNSHHLSSSETAPKRSWVRSIFTKLMRADETSSGAAASVSKTQAIRDVLTANMNCQVLNVEDVSGGCGAFYKLLIVSDHFQGKNSVKRHREVQTLLKSYIKDMHGIALTTLTPEEYKPLQSEASTQSAAR